MQRHLAGHFELVEQRERRQRDLPVLLTVTRLAHREVVWKGDPRHPRRLYPVLHRERDRGYPPLLDSVAHQPDGPVAQRSRRREQRRVHPIVCQLPGDLGSSLFGKRSGVVDGSHKAVVAVV
jgi:hypothetical protein